MKPITKNNLKRLTKFLIKGINQKLIAQYLNVKLWNIENYVHYYKLQGLRERYIKLNANKFSFTDPYFLYLIGLFLTDGHYSQAGYIKINLKSIDRPILFLLAKKFGLKHGPNPKTDTYYLLMDNYTSRVFAEKLNIKKGNKTYIAKVPICIHKQLHNYVIRGMLDGDGCIHKRNKITFFSMSPYLINFVTNYCNNHNIKYSIENHTKTGGKNISIGVDWMKFGLMIYGNIPELAMQRKRLKIQNKVDDIVRAYQMINDKNWCN